MNVIVIDTENWDELVGDTDTTDLTIEGVIAHELEHLLHELLRPGRAVLGGRGARRLRDLPQRLPDVGGSHLDLPPGLPPRDVADPLGRRPGELRRLVHRSSSTCGSRPAATATAPSTPDQEYDGEGGDRLIKLIFEKQVDGMEGVQAAIDEFNAAARPSDSALAPRSCSRTGRSPSTSTTRTPTGFDINAFDFGDPATTAWTIDAREQRVLGAAAVIQGRDAAGASGNRTAPNVPGAVRAAVRHVVRDVPQPRLDASALDLDGADTTRIAPHTGADPLVRRATRASSTASSTSTARSRGGQTLDFWTLALHRGGLGLRVRRGPRERRVGDGAAGRRRRHRRSRPTRTRRATTTRATASPARRAASTSSTSPEYIHLPATTARRRDRRALPLLDGRGLPRHRLVRRRRAVGGAAGDGLVDGRQLDRDRPAMQDNNWSLQIIAPCDLNGAEHGERGRPTERATTCTASTATRSRRRSTRGTCKGGSSP